MSDKEKIDEWIKTHDGEEHCQYCIYDDECPHGMTYHGGAPIEPPCCGREISELLDTDSILDDLKEEA